MLNFELPRSFSAMMPPRHLLKRSASTDSHLLDGASQLAPELWARIFSQIATDLDCMYQDNGGPFEMWTEQAHFRGLQLVCKMFRDIFSAYPVLSEAVTLLKSPLTSAPCLLAWLRSHSSSIRMLASTGLWLDMALASLAISTPPPLARLIATDCVSPTTMAILPVFTCLQLCDLKACSTQEATPLDLLPLQALPTLQDLRLQDGEFCNLYSASYLTNLFISQSKVWSQQDCSFASSLRRLRIECCEIEGFHSVGVCACTALELLDISESMVGAGQDNDMLQHQMNERIHIPDSITSLTSLHDVTIQVLKSHVPQPYDWLCALTTLTSLCIISPSDNFFIVPNGLTKLHHLRNFIVTGAVFSLTPPIMNLQVDWRLMHQLKEVRFIGQSVACDGKMLCLALVKSLKVLELSECVPHCSVSKQNMAFLAHCVALHNPLLALIDLHRNSVFDS